MGKNKMKRWNLSSWVVLGIWALILCSIFIWVIISSVKPNVEIYTQPWALPSKATFDNFISAWSKMKMKDYFVNSVVVVFAAILLTLVISTTTSFALTRYSFRGRNLLTTVLIASMSIPTQMLIIPLYSQMLTLDLVNSRFGLIVLYGALWYSFCLFILTGFFKTVPKELEESALIDGCGEFRIFSKIILPMVQPGIICVSVLSFVQMWNEYLLALVFCSKQKLRTIALGMYALKDAMTYTSNWGGLFAAIVIMLIPSLIVYISLQKYVVQGLTVGAVKG